MFPFFWGSSCCGSPSHYHRGYFKEDKLRFLKWMRDDLETRLAGINAAIETLERQVREDRPSS